MKDINNFARGLSFVVLLLLLLLLLVWRRDGHGFVGVFSSFFLSLLFALKYKLFPYVLVPVKGFGDDVWINKVIGCFLA